jgi:putative transposase
MPRLGTRKLHYLLKPQFQRDGIAMGRDALFILLREESLLVAPKKRYTKTTDSRQWMHQYPNLCPAMELNRPEQLWVADITYIALEEGYGYLHLITDAYSKKIMGYHLCETLAASASLKALQMALENRKYTGTLVHHSDRGLQYCSALYTRVLKQNYIAISMTQDGSPYDNAVAERVNGILKDEFGMDEVFENLKPADRQIREAVVIYNEQRPHMSNHLLTPEQMHHQSRMLPRTWRKKTTGTPGSSCSSLPS